jgi:hypothetical protein
VVLLKKNLKSVPQRSFKKINVEYADSKTSPLTKEDLASFKTFDFYPINEKYFVLAQFTTEKRNRLDEDING